MADRYLLLWVDGTISTQDVEVAQPFESLFEIHRFTAISTLDREIATLRPSLICFDFDFPTKPGLKALQKTKLSHPSIPILMLTVQHSEALAIWAFRSRVWDYLVKPIAQRELDRCLFGLREMLALRALQTQRRAAPTAMSLTPEESRWSGAHGASPLTLEPALEYVENGYRGKISSREAAELCGLTTFQLSRQFKATYGLTFQEYVIRFRIREACRLLKNPLVDVTDVALLVGFNDASYFGKIFRRYLRCSPSQYQAASGTGLDVDMLAADFDEALAPT